MGEMFQRILRAFGANRIELTTVSEAFIEFTIAGWSVFIVEPCKSGYGVGEWRQDPNAKWLTAIAGGKNRDDEGNVK